MVLLLASYSAEPTPSKYDLGQLVLLKTGEIGIIVVVKPRYKSYWVRTVMAGRVYIEEFEIEKVVDK
jgi:hypothetical protein